MPRAVKLSKHVLIIGGTRGLGRALVRHFSRDSKVSVIGKNPPAPKDAKAHVRFWQVDLLNGPQLHSTLNNILASQGKLHHLIFCQRFQAGKEDWQREIETSLTATRQIIERMSGEFDAKALSPSIVIVSSVADRQIADDQGIGYHVAKAGLVQMVRYYAVRFGRKGIRINAVSPGPFLKEENRNFYRDNKRQSLHKKIVPLGRMGRAEDIVPVVSFFCSPSAAFVTGQRLVIDGGLSLVWQESLVRRLKAN